MLTDTHAHLYWDSYKDDLNEVLKNALANDVSLIINIGTDLETSQKAIDQAKSIKSPKIYCAIGIHPHEASKYASDPGSSIQKDIQKLEKVYSQNKDIVIQIGECGLDYVLDPEFIPQGSTKEQIIELQKRLMIAQIDLAKKFTLPLSIHCRDDRSSGVDGPSISAWSEIFEYLQDTTGILHCYSGLHEHTQLALSSNYLISFAGNITYPKNDYLKEAIKTIPLDRIVLETDCPFLAPQSKRGQRNEPSSVKEVAGCIAEIKGTSIREVATQTTKNAKNLLRLTD